MIVFQDVVKKYGKEVVLEVPALEINRGDTIGLIGNNGAGKTTCFSILLDLIKASEGQVLSNGENVATTEGWKKYTSSYLDESYLINFLTPDEYFEFIGSLYNLDNQAVSEFVENYSEFFNEEILGKKKYIRDLSKGNQKKVGVIAALIGNPELVILDEPFSALDPTSQNRLKRIIKDASEGKTFLISSHDLSHVMDVSTRIIVLEKGRLVKDLINSEEAAGEIRAYFDK